MLKPQHTKTSTSLEEKLDSLKLLHYFPNLYGGGKRKKPDNDSDFSPFTDKKNKRKRQVARINKKRRKGGRRTEEEKRQKNKKNIISNANRKKGEARTEEEKRKKNKKMLFPIQTVIKVC